MADATASLLIIAPPTLQREGLVRILTHQMPTRPVSVADDVADGLAYLLQQAPALLIVDAHGTSSASLARLLARVCALRPGQRVLVLAGRPLLFHVSQQLVEMGGRLLLTRQATPQDLLAAVGRLLGDHRPCAVVQEPGVGYGQERADNEGIAHFSSRELDVLRLVATDCTSQEIATRLFISIRTVETHRRVLLEKAGTRTMVGLVLQAVRAGWLQGA